MINYDDEHVKHGEEVIMFNMINGKKKDTESNPETGEKA